MRHPNFPNDFDALRKAIARELVKVTQLDRDRVILAEGEAPNQPRPKKPYFSFKFNSPAIRFGDDSKDNVPDAFGFPTTVVNSGGPRKMVVAFDCYGNSHEEAYNYMSLWQTSLDLSNIQADLREAGIAVWLIGAVADLSALLNTGYEGRAHMECDFGIAFNLQSDLGEMDTFDVEGTVIADTGTVQSSQTIVTES